MRVPKAIVLLAALGLPIHANAANWIKVYESAQGLIWYLDTDSVARKGSQATFDFKQSDGAMPKGNVTVDCVSKTISRRILVADGEGMMPMDGRFGLIMNKVCPPLWGLGK